MGRTGRGTALAGLTALALLVSAVGPCHCLLAVGGCHRDAQKADAHACCERPVGVSAVAGVCCESDPEPVLVSVDIPEVAPATLHASPLGSTLLAHQSTPVVVLSPFQPPALARTTVLLI